MKIKKRVIKKVISVFSAFILLVSSYAPYLLIVPEFSQVKAQEVTATPTQEPTPIEVISPDLTAEPTLVPTETLTPTPTIEVTPTSEPTVTPEPTPTQTPSQWTFEKVELNKEYVSPQNSQVKLTFTKLPDPSGNIKIEEITLTEDQIKQTGSLSDKAYDITSDMKDGDFSYNLSLPIPETSKGKIVEVRFAEELINISSAEKVDNVLTKTDTSVSVANLDHFTIFVVTNPNSQVNCDIVIVGTVSNTTCFPTIQQAINTAITGDIIYVANGTYQEYLSINNKSVSLIGSGSSSTIVRPATGGAVITLNNSVDPMTIEGFTIDADNSNGRGGIYIQNNSSNVTVKNNEIINFKENGILISNSSDNNVESNILTGSLTGSNSGIYIDNNAEENTIDGNTITLVTEGTGNLYDILFTGSITKNNTVKNNIINGGRRAFQQDGSVTGTAMFSNNNIGNITGPSFAGVYLNGGSAVISGNTIKNSVRPIEFWGANNISIINNTLDGTTYDFINIGSFTGTLSPIQNNTILNMGAAKFRNQTGNDIDATQNDWSTTNLAEIEDMVWHDVDDSTKGHVDYGNPLGEGGSNAKNTQAVILDGSNQVTSNDGNLVATDNDSNGETLVIAEYENESDLPNGPNSVGTPFGTYYEIQASDGVNFPVDLTLYYTQNDLNNAGLSENQLQGLFYYSENYGEWRLYSNSGDDDPSGCTSTTSVDTSYSGGGYVGKIDTSACHLTPVGGGGDNTAPSVPVLVSPNDVSYLSTHSWTADWQDSTDDLSGVQNYDIEFYYGGSWNDRRTVTASQRTNGAGYDLTLQWRVRSRDNLGNVSNWSDPWTVTLDTITPVMSGYNISDTLLNASENTITLFGNISDVTSPIDLVKYSIWNSTKTVLYANWTNAGATDGAYDSKTESTNHIIDVSSYPDNTFVLGVRGWDKAGNKASGGDFYFTVDRTSPTANISYDITDWTNGTVTASLLNPSEAITVTNNSGSSSYTFSDNGAFTFNFVDSAGNTGSATATVNNIDKTSPSDPGTPTPDVSSPTNSTVINWVWGASSDAISGVKQYLWELWNSTIAVLSGATFGTGVSTNGLVDEEYTMRVTAEDNAGNQSGQVLSSSVIVDTVDPSSSVSSPTYDAGGNFNVSFTASDPVPASGVALTTLWFRQDTGSGFGAWITSGLSLTGTSGTFSFNPSNIDGQYEFYSISTDAAGNIELAPGLADDTTLFDNTNPTGNWVTPLTGSFLRGTIPLEVSASDTGVTVNSGVKQVRFRYKPLGGSFITISTDTSSLYQGSWNTSSLSEGNYILRAIITDNAGNTKNLDLNVTVDNTAPVIVLPGDVTAEATSPSGAVVSYTSPATTDNIDAPGTATCLPASGSTFALGDTTVTCNATDSAGNTATSTTFTVTIQDTIAPTVPVNGAPNATIISTNDFDFTWNASSDVSSVTYEYQASLNPTEVGGVLTTGLWNSGVLPSNTIHSSGASNGIWYWQVRAIDSFGNTSAWSAIWYVTIDTVVPTIASVDSDGQTYNLATTSPHTIKVTFSEDISNLPTIGVNGPAIDPQTVNDCGDSNTKTFCFNYMIPASQEAQHRIYISDVQDAAGNTMTQNSNHTFNVDTIVPTYVWNSPTVDSIYADGQSIYVDASITDAGSGITDGANCNPAIHFPVGSFFGTVSYSTATGKCTGTITLNDPSVLGDGTHHITLQVADNAGNSAISSDRNILIDNTAPTLSSKTTFSGWYNTNQTSTFAYTDTNGVVSGDNPTCDITTEGTNQTCSVTPNVCDAAGNCNTDTITSNGADIDKINPTGNWEAPLADTDVNGVVTLEVSASDVTSGTKEVEFLYKRNDGIDNFHSIATDDTNTYSTNWDTTGLALDDYILRAIINDNAGNSNTVDITIGVSAVVSLESAASSTYGTATITWTTDRPTSTRVVYDTVSHGTLGASPNYGYAFSTGTNDTSPKVTSHSVTLTGLSNGTTYYYRSVSEGSPITVSDENSFQTLSTAGAPASSGGGGTVAGVSTTAFFAPSDSFFTPETLLAEEVLGQETEATSTPIPSPEVKGIESLDRSWLWWLLTIPVLGAGYYFYRRLRKY